MTTPLQSAMLNKIATSEFNSANGALPTNHFDTTTWANVIIESSEDKGVATSLMKAHLIEHTGTDRDATIKLTEAGYLEFARLFLAK